jgi:uncharacterized protein (DUF1330 family)
MKRSITIAIAMLAGATLGAAAVNGLNAQTMAPGAYAIIDISEINNLNDFRTLIPKADASNAEFGAQVIARTENIVALDGTPPKRFVIVGFDSIDKAMAWDKSAGQAEVNTIRKRSTKSRTFIVDDKI